MKMTIANGRMSMASMVAWLPANMLDISFRSISRELILDAMVSMTSASRPPTLVCNCIAMATSCASWH